MICIHNYPASTPETQDRSRARPGVPGAQAGLRDRPDGPAEAGSTNVEPDCISTVTVLTPLPPPAVTSRVTPSRSIFLSCGRLPPSRWPGRGHDERLVRHSAGIERDGWLGVLAIGVAADAWRWPCRERGPEVAGPPAGRRAGGWGSGSWRSRSPSVAAGSASLRSISLTWLATRVTGDAGRDGGAGRARGRDGGARPGMQERRGQVLPGARGERRRASHWP